MRSREKERFCESDEVVVVVVVVVILWKWRSCCCCRFGESDVFFNKGESDFERVIWREREILREKERVIWCCCCCDYLVREKRNKVQRKRKSYWESKFKAASVFLFEFRVTLWRPRPPVSSKLILRRSRPPVNGYVFSKILFFNFFAALLHFAAA
jgi:hypothetical protein